jgi:FkbM family methyltransferase
MSEPSDAIRIHDSPLHRLAKRLAKPLSRIVGCAPLLRASRYADAYFNVLMGKGSGTGWDLAEEVAAAVSTLHTETPRVLDIGANKGEWTRLLLERVPRASVVMFEPAVGCHEYLNPLVGERVSLVRSAVGATPGRARLWSSEQTDGAASLHPRRDSYFEGRTYQPTEVPVTTIDTWFDEAKIDFVDFIKLDIEGHELAALQGAERALSDGRIGAFSFEFGSANINSRTFLRDFWDYLHPKKYRLARITPGGRMLPIHSYYEDLEYFRGVTNYVAVHTEIPGGATQSGPRPIL